MKQDTVKFTNEKYFNGHQNTRSFESNWSLFKTFTNSSVQSMYRVKSGRVELRFQGLQTVYVHLSGVVIKLMLLLKNTKVKN